MANDRLMSGATINLVSAACIKGTGHSFTSTVTTAGLIGGKFVTTLGAQTNAALPTTDAVTGAAFPALSPNKATVYVIGQTAAGALAMCQGSIEDTQIGVTTTVGAFIRAPQFPSLPDDFMPLCYGLTRTAPSASSWVLGTGDWAASGVTSSTWQNVGTLPDRPQVV